MALRVIGIGGGVSGSGGGPVPASRRIDTVAPLRGGGDLSANRTLTIDTFVGTGPGAVPGGSGNDSTKFLNGSGAWATPAGGALALQPETPAGTIDSSNVTFTIAADRMGMLVLNHVVQIEGIDFTRVTTTITYAVAPDTNDVHRYFSVH